MLAFLGLTTLASFLEAGMLICFGVSWPVAITKTLRAKKVSGKSFGFLVLVFIGYLCGIGAKFSIASASGKPLEWVTALYALNALMVAVDGLLYLRYSPKDNETVTGSQ